MLAAKFDTSANLRFPVLATPKIDGIRCTITPDGPRTRSLKRVPNRYIEKQLIDLPVGFDGELTVGERFQDCTSGIMTEDGQPDFYFWVFDDCFSPERPYASRVADYMSIPLPLFCRKLQPEYCGDFMELSHYYDRQISAGAEGVCFRLPSSPYKYGRATLKEQYLVKWKQIVSDEAFIIDCVELMHNDNSATTNALGLTERSSHQANMIPAGKLGAFRVRSHKWTNDFYIGTGFTDRDRQSFWLARESLKGRLVRFKYHAHSNLNVPREPVFEGFRSEIDL